MLYKSINHPISLQVVEIKNKQKNPNEMDYKFYLIYVSHASIEDNVPDKSDHDYPRMYLRVQHLIEFDTFTATHGPSTYMDGNIQNTTTTIDIKRSSNQTVYNPILIPEVTGNKRKAFDCFGPPAKQQKTIHPAYFIPELAHVVAMCDEKLPFIALAQELTKRKIPHSGIQVEANTTSIVLKILALPEPNPSPVTHDTASPKVCYIRELRKSRNTKYINSINIHFPGKWFTCCGEIRLECIAKKITIHIDSITSEE